MFGPRVYAFKCRDHLSLHRCLWSVVYLSDLPFSKTNANLTTHRLSIHTSLPISPSVPLQTPSPRLSFFTPPAIQPSDQFSFKISAFICGEGLARGCEGPRKFWGAYNDLLRGTIGLYGGGFKLLLSSFTLVNSKYIILTSVYL